MVQSGFSAAWWPQALSCFCFLKNLVDLLDDGTAYQRRCNADFPGPLIPFGAEITWKPISQKDKACLHVFGEIVLSGVFLGYEQQEGGGWSGDLCILNWGETENGQHFSDMHIKRFKSTEVLAVQDGDTFRFPLAKGVLRQPGTSRHKEPRLRRPRSSSDWGGPSRDR